MRILIALLCGITWMSVVYTAQAQTAGPPLSIQARDYMGDAVVALSFDDGPDEVLTPRLLDILKEAGVTATFCLVGRRVAQWPSIVRRMYAEGHELCNHSWDHATLTQANVGREIAKTDAAVEAASGARPRILRAPYGNTQYVGSCYTGRPFVGWGAWDDQKQEYVGGDTLDWLHRSPPYITRAAVGTRPESIVLMHDIHRTTIASVPGIIAGLKARGFRFVHASQLWRSRCRASVAGN